MAKRFHCIPTKESKQKKRNEQQKNVFSTMFRKQQQKQQKKYNSEKKFRWVYGSPVTMLSLVRDHEVWTLNGAIFVSLLHSVSLAFFILYVCWVFSFLLFLFLKFYSTNVCRREKFYPVFDSVDFAFQQFLLVEDVHLCSFCWLFLFNNVHVNSSEQNQVQHQIVVSLNFCLSPW